MKKLKSFEFKNRNKKYDLEPCESGPVLFVRGEDYTITDSSFRNHCYITAFRKGMTCKTASTDEGVVVQFFREDAK